MPLSLRHRPVTTKVTSPAAQQFHTTNYLQLPLDVAAPIQFQTGFQLIPSTDRLQTYPSQQSINPTIQQMQQMPSIPAAKQFATETSTIIKKKKKHKPKISSPANATLRTNGMTGMATENPADLGTVQRVLSAGTRTTSATMSAAPTAYLPARSKLHEMLPVPRTEPESLIKLGAPIIQQPSPAMDVSSLTTLVPKAEAAGTRIITTAGTTIESAAGIGISSPTTTASHPAPLASKTAPEIGNTAITAIPSNQNIVWSQRVHNLDGTMDLNADRCRQIHAVDRRHVITGSHHLEISTGKIAGRRSLAFPPTTSRKSAGRRT